MGGAPHRKSRKNAKNKHFKKYVLATSARTRDMDQIHDDLDKLRRKAGEEEGKEELEERAGKPFDEDLPAGGAFYCVETAKYFISADALAKHKKSKVYKQRVRELLHEKKYTQDEADAVVGLRKEVLPPASAARGDVKMQERA